MPNSIHPTAIVSHRAELGENNVVGPFAIVEDDVVLGNGNEIAAHVVLKSGSRFGNNNRVYEHAVIGGIPQDIGYKPMRSFVEIGNDNVLRESVTIHRASKVEQSTVLGNNIFMMNLAHIGHDCKLGNNVVIAPCTGIGGHVHIDDRAFLSGGVMVHQFVRIGRFAMIGGNCKVTQDVLPFVMLDGLPGRVRGLNRVGLKRNGFSREDILGIKQAYRLIFRSGLPLQDIITGLRAQGGEHITRLADFIASSKRGFHRAERTGGDED